MLPSRHPSQQPRVPVLSSAGMPLIPCRPVRARRLINEGKAAAKWRKGFFYIQMTVETGLNTQTTVIGVDPGSKREAFTVKAKHATFLNLQSHARDGKRIQKDLETRANARRARRNRKTPCRPPRFHNRGKKGYLPPSTKARWQLKLNIIKHLCALYPISVAVHNPVTRSFVTRRWGTVGSLMNTRNQALCYATVDAAMAEIVQEESHVK